VDNVEQDRLIHGGVLVGSRQELERLTGRCFSISTRCNDAGVVVAEQLTGGVAVPFEEADIAGQHVYLEVPADKLLATLRHYCDNKSMRPAGTSACIVVPHYMLRRLEVTQLLKGMQPIKEIEITGTPLAKDVDEHCLSPALV
jgi:hypothetical protein